MAASRIWNSIPLKIHILVLMTTFFFVYFNMFGTHFFFNREISYMNSNAGIIVQRLSQSGKVQDISHENSQKSSIPTNIGGKSSKNATPMKKINGDTHKNKEHNLDLKRAPSEENNKVEGKEIEDRDKDTNEGRKVNPDDNSTLKQSKSKPIGGAASPQKLSVSSNGSVMDKDDAKKPTPKLIENMGAHDSSKAAIGENARETGDGTKTGESESLGKLDAKPQLASRLSEKVKTSLQSKTSEWVFSVGDKGEHVAAFRPICVDTESQNMFVFEGEPECSKYDETEGWLDDGCRSMRDTPYGEYLVKMQSEQKPHAWLMAHEREIRWVRGLTVFQVLDRGCGNIAHYAGRIMFLQHILRNIVAYSGSPSTVENVLIAPTYDMMKRYLNPKRFDFWHKNVLQAIIAPSVYAIGTMGNFLHDESRRTNGKEPFVHLLQNYSMKQSGVTRKKYVCFERAIIPGFLKGRFFVDDIDYPSTKALVESIAEGAPTIPRDSLDIRERVNTMVSPKTALPKRKKEILLLDRGGLRRVFDGNGRRKVLMMMRKAAEAKGYRMTVVNFNGMPFYEQYKIMRNVSVAVGIHGANLVNTMFMPPLSVLFELFPHGFIHSMYANGGNAGLKYVSHEMRQGKRFKGQGEDESINECIKSNEKCKVHYRDAMMEVTNGDIADMERIFNGAIEWCDGLPTGSPGQ